MDVRAAVAFEAGKPLEVTTVTLEGPRAGEVLVEIKATGICHTDEFTRSGADPEGLFPAILGHEGAGIVVDIGAGVTSVKKGDHVIPLYTPECRQCPSCLSRKTNLCTAIRGTQGIRPTRRLVSCSADSSLYWANAPASTMTWGESTTEVATSARAMESKNSSRARSASLSPARQQAIIARKAGPMRLPCRPSRAANGSTLAARVESTSPCSVK